MQTEQLKVTGMTCGGCTSRVTSALKAVNGVSDVAVSLSDSQATVQYDEKLTSPEQLKSVVLEAGYGVGTSDNTQQPEGKGCCG
ncbi:MAG: heavy-metal-associated domain-containing protein [Bacteroidia bacterium]|nr:heavy-metal-associated domain-containing protein [Methylotenera sp.]